MKTSILFVAHCLLNPLMKTCPGTPGEKQARLISGLLAHGVALVQLPCPELVWGGFHRWGVTVEQLDSAVYRRMACDLARSVFEPFARVSGALGVLGVKGSPSCGVRHTCFGFSGGEIGALTDPPSCEIKPGTGQFMVCAQSVARDLGMALRWEELDEGCEDQWDWTFWRHRFFVNLR